MRHASQALRAGLSPTRLFAYASTARVTTFFPSLASTNPPRSKLGRSFGQVTPQRDSHRSKDCPVKGSVVIPLKIFLSELPKSSPADGQPPFPNSHFQKLQDRGPFVLPPCWRAEKSTKIMPLVNFFRFIFSQRLPSTPSLQSKT